MTRRGFEKSTTAKATVSPAFGDLCWAAGFIEGEGCFQRLRNCEKVTVPQVNLDPLLRLQALFGGNICQTQTRGFPINYWGITGSRARGLMMTLYSFMTARRKAQIRKALGLA
jgi:hypothetical protein